MAFAPPLKDLGKNSIGVAAAPTSGMGLGLNAGGRIPANVLILDSTGTGRRIASGQITVTWPGGSATSNNIAANHLLGTTPVSATATPNGIAGTGVCTVVCFLDATTVSVTLETASGFAPLAAATTLVSWVAIG